MMAEWVWILALFVALTAGYIGGFTAGSWRSDRAPTENAWINVRRYGIDAQKENAMASIRVAHEEQMALIERGVFDAEEERGGCPPEEEDAD